MGDLVVPDIILDLETTGKRTPNARVVEIAAIALDSRLQEVDHFHILTNPGEEALRFAAPEALQKNGISLEEIRSGIPSPEAAVRFQEFLKRYPKAKLHAFNNEFDRWFVARDPWNIPESSWGECIMVEAMEIMSQANVLEIFKNGEPKWPRLDESAKFFGVSLGSNHRALPDARVAAAVYAAICRHRIDAEDVATAEARYMMEDGL